MKSNGSGYVRFIEPYDERANKLVASMLQADAETSAIVSHLCSDAKSHNLWQLPGHHIATLMERGARDKPEIRFKIWYRRGSGPICPWIFKKRVSLERASGTESDNPKRRRVKGKTVAKVPF